MICDNCSHKCELNEGMTGRCHARKCVDGAVVSDTYGKITSIALDPIEKKPLKMFKSGSNILSIGSYGCNMTCPWCQNDSISRGPTEYDYLNPEDIVEIALSEQRRNNNIGIAFTYNEPLIGYEYVLDTAKLSKQNGLVNAVVSNGMLSRNRFDELLNYVDAYNIDYKSGYEDGYRRIGGDLELVLNNIRSAERKSHVELTTLIVPGFNDTVEEIRLIAGTISDINPYIPLHITRFFPAGMLRNLQPTDIGLMYELVDVAQPRQDLQSCR